MNRIRWGIRGGGKKLIDTQNNRLDNAENFSVHVSFLIQTVWYCSMLFFIALTVV